MSKKAPGETEGSSVDVCRMLMPASQSQQHGTAETALVRPRRQGGRVFECGTCGRRFPTYQALGGHRASHSRPATPTPTPTPRPRAHTIGVGDDDGSACARPCRLDMRGGTAKPTRGRVHGCPVCGVEFAVGQALGGHMKRHRPTADGDASAHRHGAGKTATSVDDYSGGDDCTGEVCLDLNLNLSQAGNCDRCRKATVGAAAKNSSLF